MQENFLLPANRQRRSFTVIAGYDSLFLDNLVVEKVIEEGSTKRSWPTGYTTNTAIADLSKLLKEDYEAGRPIFMAFNVRNWAKNALNKSSFVLPSNYTFDIILYASKESTDYIEYLRENSGFDSFTVIDLPTIEE